MSIVKFKAVVLDPNLGEFAQLPDGGIVNIGGTSNPTFTINGMPVILANGAASDGSGHVISVGTAVAGYEHIQSTEGAVWAISHGLLSKRLQVTIWDENDEQVIADQVKIASLEQVVIRFNTPITGRAIIMAF